MKKVILHITGQAPDGRTVLGGWFHLVTTYGIPMDIVIDQISDRGCVPDWLEFYLTAISEGWKPKRTMNRLKLVVADIYGPHFCEGWWKVFNEKLSEIEELKNGRKDSSGDST